MSDAPPPYTGAPPSPETKQGPPAGYPQGPPPAGYQQPTAAQPQGGYPQGPPPQAGGYPQGPPPQAGGIPPQGYSQPAPGVYNQGTPQGQTVITQPPNTTVIVASGAPNLGACSAQTNCPNCHAQVMTTVSYEIGLLTWLLVGAICFIGGWLCCWIPCVIDACKDIVHTCPNCKHIISRNKRL